MLSVLLGPLWAQRIVRFGTVAVFCTLLQALILLSLVGHGWDKLVANGAGFLLAAQVNFALSSFLTWGDRWLEGSISISKWRICKSVTWRWLKFHSAAAMSLLVNEAVVFILAVHFTVWVLLASLAGVLTGAGVSFLANHIVTFRQSTSSRRKIGESIGIG